MKEIRNTIQRSLILNAVQKLHTHPSANEIYQYIVKDHPTISRGTVYRNLKLLSETGEIRRVEISDAADRFDFTVAGHYHIRCLCCGKVDDVKMHYLSNLADHISDARGYRIDSHEIVFKGVCSDCLNKRKEGRMIDNSE